MFSISNILQIINNNKALHVDLKSKAKNHLQACSYLDNKQIHKALRTLNQGQDQFSNILLSELQNNSFSSPYLLSDIIRCVNKNNQFRKDLNLKEKAKQLLNDEQSNALLDEQTIKDCLRLATYEHESKFPGEMDLLGMFPDLQLLFHVEVKSNQEENKANDKNLTDAAEQMSRYAQHIAQRHDSILSNK